jgi:hypothetical protein
VAKKRKNPGDLKDARAIMWEGLEMLEIFLQQAKESKDSQEARSIMHCLAQSIGVYARLTEVGEFEERLERLQKGLNEVRAEARQSRIPA